MNLRALRAGLRRRSFGPLRASPLALLSFGCAVLLAVAIAVPAQRDMRVRARLQAVLSYAAALARGPTALAAAAPPDVGAVRVDGDGVVHVELARPVAVAGRDLRVRVVERDGDHWLQCRAGVIASGLLPATCRPGGAGQRLEWPPAPTAR